MDYHPLDRRILVNCRIDLEDPDVIEDYRRLRQIHAWIGQIGRLPDSVLYSLAMRHADFPDPPKPEVEEEVLEAVEAAE